MAVVRSSYSVWVLDRELVWNVWWKPLADTIWINLVQSRLVDLQLFAPVGPDIFWLLFACLRAAGMMRERIYCPALGFS